MHRHFESHYAERLGGGGRSRTPSGLRVHRHDDGLAQGISVESLPQSEQRAFGRAVIEDFGYDFDRGRQDVSAHPFTTSFSPNDVRVTTRYDEENVTSALSSTIHEAMDYYLGVVPETDANGVLQDVHWSQAAFGYFPGYTLGTLTAAQLMEAIYEEFPGLDDRIERGEFEPVLGWLRTFLHQHGRKLEAPDLLERATGEALCTDAWLRYVRDKFRPLYGL